MALRIREVVIRAEIGSDQDKGGTRQENEPSPETVTQSETGIMTRRFYEQDFQKVNER